MRVLWQQPEATVAQVLEALRGRPRLAYNTVLTTLRILEQKGCVTHRLTGRAFVYRARLTERDARRHAIRHLVSRLFHNSPGQLVASILGDGAIGSAEIETFKLSLAKPARG